MTLVQGPRVGRPRITCLENVFREYTIVDRYVHILVMLTLYIFQKVHDVKGMVSMSLETLNPTLNKLLKSFKLDITYIKAQGTNLYDQDGKKYLDFISQYGAVPFGYNPPDICAYIKKYLDLELPNMIQPSVPIMAVELAEMLIIASPGEMAQATFCQSGAEAVETAIKLARARTKKLKIISAENSFHGKTMGALSATSREVYQQPFFAPVEGFESIPFNNLHALEHKLKTEGNQIAAFIVEPIQGEGGIIIPSPGYLKEVEFICHRYGVLLIVDEIQTGLGRTGYLFACDKEEVKPDILLLAKALGGGFVPLGVCLSTKEVWSKEFGQLHSSTFANNNFTCAIGVKVLEKLLTKDRVLVQEIKTKGDYLMHGLRLINGKYPGVIKEIRGQGLMAGIEFNGFDGSESFSIKYLADQGGLSALLAGYLLHIHSVRVAPFLNNPMTLRLEPAYTVNKLELDKALKAIEKVVEILYYQDYCKLYSYLFETKDSTCVLPGSDTVSDFRPYQKRITCSEIPEGKAINNKFAFLIHYPDTIDVKKNNPSFEVLSDKELEVFLDWEASLESEPDQVIHLPALKSKAGHLVEGWLVGVPYSGRHLIDMPRDKAVNIITKAVLRAKELGAQVVGLGAYTSVVTKGGSALTGNGVAITSGNSYTVATGYEALIKGAEMMEIRLNKAIGCVIGATGSIGRVCTLMLSEDVEQIILVGNPAKEKTSLRRLEKLADEVYAMAYNKIKANDRSLFELTGVAQWLNGFLNNINKDRPETFEELLGLDQRDKFSWGRFINDNLSRKGRYSSPPIRVTVNLNQALIQADLIITASNSVSHLVGPEFLKPGSVICDIARPADVSHEVLEKRNDILVIEGGLVEYPDKVCFGQNMGYPPGMNLACLSETMLLALEGDFRDFSIGLKMPIEDVYYLRSLAKKHGFKLSMLRNEKGEISEREIREIKNAVFSHNTVNM